MAAPTAASYLQLPDHGQSRRFEVADEVAPQRARVTAGPVLYEAGKPHGRFTRRIVTATVLVQLQPGIDAAVLAQAVGAAAEKPVSFAPDYFLFEATKATDALPLAARLTAQPGVLSAEPLLAREQQKRFVPSDPYFTNQWHLLNTGQKGGTAGIDINVTNVWDTYKGDGICIAIVDDGLQRIHVDLQPNYNGDASTNVNDGNSDPSPDVTSDFHGTACAGIAAATGDNALGVCGVAFHASLAGIRLLGAPETDANEADAFTFRNDLIHIKSNSWGPPDDGATLAGPGPLAQAALASSVQSGRNGNGTIFVWAAGNGLTTGDNANYDGYANSIYAIAVTAISDQGKQTDNAEPGACIAVAAPGSSTGRQGITTTDLLGNSGYNGTGAVGDMADHNYTQLFGNEGADATESTSAATPMVAGVVALMLQANPNLGWRDVQEILMRTATKNDPTDTDWKTNSAGFHFNHKYGAGLVNARAAVNASLTWTNLSAQTNLAITQTNLAIVIPDGDTNGITRTFDLSGSNLRVERVTLTANITHPYRGDLAITVTAPSGIQSRVAEERGNDSGADYVNWTFSTVHDWGEGSQGLWKVKLADLSSGDEGTLTSLTLTVYGTKPGTVSTNAFKIVSILPHQTNTLINFASSAGSSYSLERRTNLTTDNWSTVVSNVSASGSSTQVTDPNPVASASFYRVRSLP